MFLSVIKDCVYTLFDQPLYILFSQSHLTNKNLPFLIQMCVEQQCVIATDNQTMFGLYQVGEVFEILQMIIGGGLQVAGRTDFQRSLTGT
jgi:hypothetical protein